MSLVRVLKFYALVALAIAACVGTCRANIVLLIEDPVGPVGYFSDGGHTAVWISDACLERDGTTHICDTGDGVIFTKMSGWKAYGYAGIPASMYLYGATVDGADAISPDNNDKNVRLRFWHQHLAAIYPLVEPERGALLLAHAYRRRIYLLKLRTTPAEDAAALMEMRAHLGHDSFHFWTNNCTDFSRKVLDTYFKGDFGRQWYHDLAITTPEGVGNRVEKFGRAHPNRDLMIGRIQPETEDFSTRRTHDATGTVLFDWKYAVPLVVFSPVTYASFGAMHVWDDGLHVGGAFRRHAKPHASDQAAVLRWSSTTPIEDEEPPASLIMAMP